MGNKDSQIANKLMNLIMKYRIRCLAVASWVFILGAGNSLQAHEDPWGDIRPNVVVRDGRFEINFRSVLPDDDPNRDEAKELYQMIYTKDGKLFAPRHPLDHESADRGPGRVDFDGRCQQLGDVTFYFLPSRSIKPSYVLRLEDGEQTRVRLPWPEEVALQAFEDVCVVAEGIAILGMQNILNPDSPLEFFWFPHDVSIPPVSINIGETARIFYPVASNLVFAVGRFWLAYMRPMENDEWELVLWSWQPGDKEARVEKLDSPALWNTHLSLAAIGDHLCLAYHWENPEPLHRTPLAEIVTLFRKAE